MTRDRNVDDILDNWFTEGPTDLPDRTVAAIVDRLNDVPQPRPVRLPWRGNTIRFVFQIAGATAVVVVAALALGVLSNRPGVGVKPSPTPSPTPSATASSPAVFTEIAPGEMVEMPEWPLTERTSPPSVWTGTELIVWGDGIYGVAEDGAAFDLAKGTWRVIADSPLNPRCCHAVAWTGSEMLVWGGRVENRFNYEGAAYNPVTDAWRRLSVSPAYFDGKDPIMVWAGNEAVVLGVSGNSDTSGEYIAAAAYDPAADTWRALANAPGSVHLGSAWWTGDAIVVAEVGYEPEFDQVARYDMATDRWTLIDVGPSAAIVGVPDADGTVATFVDLPSESGAPTQLIDGTGRLLAELPAFPGDPDVFGDIIGASGVWAGSEAVFEIWNESGSYQPEQIWALNPDTQAWRRLDTDTTFPRIDDSVVAAGDLLLMWNRPGDHYRGLPRVCCVAPPSKGGSIYRVGTSAPSQVP